MKVLTEYFEVFNGHISTGEDFFSYEDPIGDVDVIVSNPPYSKRNAIFKRIYSWGIPYALLINTNGLFDAKCRTDLFRENGVELLIPKGRVKFITQNGIQGRPNFQAIYVCNRILDEKIVFSDYEF